MIKRTFTKVLDINKIYNTAESFTIARGDTVQFSFTFTNGEASFPLNDMTKARLYAKRIKSNGVDASSTPLFAKEITYPSTVTSVDATFISSETAGAAGQYLLTIILFDANDNTITTSNIPFELFENGYNGIYQPAEDFRDECLTAKADAEAAANNAEQSAGLASDFAQAAEQQKNLAQEYASEALFAADAASVSKFDAQTAKTAAETAASTALGSADGASVYAYNAEQSATLAQEVSRIAIIPISTTSQTIQPNKCYTLLTNDVDAYTLTPEMPSGNPEYLLQAVVQLKTGNTAPVINWGGNPSFFNGKIPTINANSSYDVIFEFDNITLSWSVGVMKK